MRGAAIDSLPFMKTAAPLVIAALVLGCGSGGSGSGGGGQSTTGGAGGASTSSSGGAGGTGDTGGDQGGTTSGTTTSASGGTGGMTMVVCDPIPGAQFGSLGTIGEPTKSPPPAEHPDLNMKMRGWEPVGFDLALVDYGGDTDALAPKLNTMYGDDHVPTFVQNYAVHDWDWANGMVGGLIGDWDVTLVAMATTPGEILEIPHSGYDIGQGKTARLLFADDDSVTLKYTGEDNVVYGYTIHMVGVCLDPDLKALYQANDAAGRTELPALSGDQPFARALGTSVLVAIRDTGAFMDPRSKKDWW